MYKVFYNVSDFTSEAQNIQKATDNLSKILIFLKTI